MVESKSEYSLEELQSLAYQASSQYLDLETAENELQQWIRNANRGPQALLPSNAPQAQASNGSITPALPAPSWNVPFDPNLQQPPQSHHSLIMNQHSDSQYHYHDSAQAQAYYPPPPASPGPQSPVFQPYYHQQPFNSPGDTPSHPNDSSSTYPYPSPSPLSPTNTDPELKRIRNTAASARFRAKKKRREQSLERNAKEKREALQKLETRIEELEAENKFLKGLIFDEGKMRGVTNELDRVRKLKREMECEVREGERDDGVGT